MEEYVAKSVLKKELNISNLHAGIIDALQNIVDEIPAADVQEVKHGQWKKVSDKAPKYCCTKCNHLYNNKEYKHCPFCGARMDGKENDE